MTYTRDLDKTIQSMGNAGVWRADAVHIPYVSCVPLPVFPFLRAVFDRYMNIFISTWVLLAAGLICTLPMIHLRVKNHTDLADETL